MKLCLTAALVLLLATPAAAAPVQIPLSTDHDQIGSQTTAFDEDPVTVSIATGSAIQAVERGSHGVQIVRRTATGPPLVLAQVDDPAPNANRHVSGVAASATSWVAAISGGRSDGNRGEGGEDVAELDEVIVTGSLQGGPARRLVACRTDAGQSLIAAISGADVAFSGAGCAGSRGVWFVPAGGAPRRLATGGDVQALSAAAVLTSIDDHGELLGVGGGTTALPRLSGAAFDDDGTLLTLLDGPPPTLARVAASGPPVPIGPVPAAANPPGNGFVAGGGRALAAPARFDGVVAIDATSGAVSYAGVGQADAISAQPLGVDATRAAWLSEDCARRPEVVIDATSPDRPGQPTTERCPLQLVSPTLPVRGMRASLSATCPEGCAASVVLRAGGHAIGNTGFTLAHGQTKTVHIALNRRGRALLARRRSVAAQLVQTDGWLYVKPPPFDVRLQRGG